MQEENLKEAGDLPKLVKLRGILANLLSLHPDPGIRNVPEAIQLAERGCRISDYRDPILLDTLGAAYAASGRYAEARKIDAQGFKLAEAGGKKPLADRIRRRIETYQNR